MKPGPFDYAAPTSLREALRLLSDTERDVKVLAGGQSLIPMLNMRLARPELVVDITRVAELGRMSVDADGALHIGAAVRQAAAAADPAVRGGWPLLAAAIEQIGHPQIRNRGTVCGSLVHHDPAAELPAVAVALDARFTVTGPGRSRTVPAGDFSSAPSPPTSNPMSSSPRWSFRPPPRAPAGPSSNWSSAAATSPASGSRYWFAGPAMRSVRPGSSSAGSAAPRCAPPKPSRPWSAGPSTQSRWRPPS